MTVSRNGAANQVVQSSEVLMEHLRAFFELHSDIIKESHGFQHAIDVYHHACKAIQSHEPRLSSSQEMEVKAAALLHDTDDKKYFPNAPKGSYPNAQKLLDLSNVPQENADNIIAMISLVGCSENGKCVPDHIREEGSYYKLIPRWSDRLLAVGKSGVVRCYQYNQEKGRPLSAENSPQPHTEAEVWQFATPERFEAYQQPNNEANKKEDDMISHYYDKLLHVARPPPAIVQNEYLINAAKDSAKELVEVCLRYGRTGQVDVGYIKEIAEELGITLD
mmetsp:Transcript_9280/g.20062  ORF Transcript_9280/g.20062 Transcript_9280/m.20062 type:complete len:277 (-) Transcript_9280:229-1059(-)